MKFITKLRIAIDAFNRPQASVFGVAFFDEVQHAVDTGRTVLFEAQHAPAPGRIIMQYIRVEDAAVLRANNRSGGMTYFPPK